MGSFESDVFDRSLPQDGPIEATSSGPDALLAEWDDTQRKLMAVRAEFAAIFAGEHSLIRQLERLEKEIKALAHSTGMSWSNDGWEVVTIPAQSEQLDSRALLECLPWLEETPAVSRRMVIDVDTKLIKAMVRSGGRR